MYNEPDVLVWNLGPNGWACRCKSKQFRNCSKRLMSLILNNRARTLLIRIGPALQMGHWTVTGKWIPDIECVLSAQC